MKYLIWSNQHNMWWRPNGCGYTPRIEAAGVYDADRAISICNQANMDWDEFNPPNELPIAEEIARQLEGCTGKKMFMI